MSTDDDKGVSCKVEQINTTRLDKHVILFYFLDWSVTFEEIDPKNVVNALSHFKESINKQTNTSEGMMTLAKELNDYRNTFVAGSISFLSSPTRPFNSR